MRRGLASLIMGLSLTVGSVAWAGFALSSTVLDPDVSPTLARQLLTNEQLREVLVSRTADALQAQVPQAAPLPRQRVEEAAERLLTDQAAIEAVENALVDAHRRALNGDESTVVANTVDLNAAGRSALVDTQPELAAVLPANPAVPVVVPSSGLAWLAGLKGNLDRWVTIGALLALSGVAVAFVVTTDRPGVLRRAAMWAFGTAAFWLFVGFGVPILVDVLLPRSFAVLGAMASLVSTTMKAPAIVLAVVGIGLLTLSYLFPAMDRRRGSAVLHAGPSETRYPGPAVSTASPRHPNAADEPRSGIVGPPGSTIRPSDHRSVPSSGPGGPRPGGPEPEPTRELPVVTTDRDRVAAEASEPMWIEGYGYLDDDRVGPFFRADPGTTSDDSDLHPLWPTAWQLTE